MGHHIKWPICNAVVVTDIVYKYKFATVAAAATCAPASDPFALSHQKKKRNVLLKVVYTLWN